MRVIVLFGLLFSLALANTPARILDLYAKEEYKSACLEGSRILRDYKDDDTFVNAYAIACLKSDFIDLAAPAVMYLRSNKESRGNAAYILTVVLQKKLLYHALADNIDLSSANLPDTPHILSKVYNAYADGNYKQLKSGTYEIKIEDKTILLDSYNEGGHFKIRIRQFVGTQLEDEHIYW